MFIVSNPFHIYINVGAEVKRGVDGIEASKGRCWTRWSAPKDPDIPVIGRAADLEEADGILFGFPTRFGSMAAQMKAFFDATGSCGRSRSWRGSPRDSLRRPVRARTFSADGSRQPTDVELALAEHQGKYMAAVVKRLSPPHP
ncbi:unnamed protein product [Spirodela intermedia]|uniref:NAD(P)H dehydrogenase (quinone) n=1 Tax=Spirodela intermedia TaxID=51605 RepID=A0ABN7E844_SPIIN|nr:unnamed protein product [Spirodela intermedia]